ncbi:MAG: tRNA (adenosine(37)-N6)-dimethylallyltransferase MiaA [Sporolactobacillus sp.]
MKQRTLAVVGPTAVGKTKIGVYLAHQLNGEVINGDASQMYRELSIGTAKVTATEMAGIPHHLIDVCDPSDNYTAADYQRDARSAAECVRQRGRLPIFVGGSGLYIKAALYDYHFSNIQEDRVYRSRLEAMVRQSGAAALHRLLERADPRAAATIHPHNTVRIIRALEVCHATGKPFSALPRTADRLLFPTVVIGLTMARDELYRRIDQRVNEMMEHGLLAEVRNLYDRGLANCRALQAIGYKEFFPFFSGQVALEQAVATLKQNSRHYAKRQMTWFQGQMDVRWITIKGDPEHFNEQATAILAYVKRALDQLD